MIWQTNDTAPTDGRQIVVRGLNDQSKMYEFSIVFYHEPMQVWYGGPGIVVRREDIQQWSDLESPK